jgi:hypothetical protein
MFETFLDTGKVPTKDNFTAATVAYLEAIGEMYVLLLLNL